ncbi:5-carboxymethyl-2-hydroxymuconate Delta-isomerase [Dehalogenimonas lykanthroporepellens BL-DC-9]|jgi:2-keto-4-pentenoate hydratase/2-oxohepta-3-ene-1,7-dioic acid hydratase in catechol pathway|nr:5-carboxymethyl-2-hydroxymuconate Delta-isomerase [Dehalogenimonas lykanthroporepellens BL-DC-9]
MNIVRFNRHGEARYGVAADGSIRELRSAPWKEMDFTGQEYPLEGTELLAPCQPSKIVCLGVNYHGHAREMKHELPDAPLIFLKPSTAVIGPEADIVYPEASHRVDYEAELALVIKKPAWRVARADAGDYILGYTCFNDVTARDLQKLDGQWTRAKGFNTFAAVGPWISTGVDPSSLTVETYLNGERRQHGNTADLIFHIDYLIHFITHVMTLLPGDMVTTGTPSGIGSMEPGDTVEVRIENIGTLRNYVTRVD